MYNKTNQYIQFLDYTNTSNILGITSSGASESFINIIKNDTYILVVDDVSIKPPQTIKNPAIREIKQP
jgi:hypothetical protein